MAGMLWPTTFWIWEANRLNWPEFERRLRAIPGPKGVLIKAVDGDHVYDPLGRPNVCQWSDGLIELCMGAGAQVGMWTFNYGTGPVGYAPPHTVYGEMVALEDALSRSAYHPAALVLNIESQIMGGQAPAKEVEQIVFGATMRVQCKVGVSSVWHWANTMGWPFASAAIGGAEYWSNQVYGTDWLSYLEYDTLYARLAGGLPDYISLPATVSPAQIVEYGKWAIARQAPGVNWWTAEGMGEGQWQAAGQVARLFGGVPVETTTEDAALESEYQRLGVGVLGEKRHKSWLSRPYHTGSVLFTQFSVVGQSPAETARIQQGLMDDAITHLTHLGMTGIYA